MSKTSDSNVLVKVKVNNADHLDSKKNFFMRSLIHKINIPDLLFQLIVFKLLCFSIFAQ